MGVGLQVFNASGQLTFTSGDYLPRYLGSFQTGLYNGSHTDPNLSDSSGTPFVLYFPLSGSTSLSGAYAASTGQISFSTTNNTITWTFSSGAVQGPGGTVSNGLVIYGLK